MSTEIPNDLFERIEEAKEDGESRSAALERFIRAGLEEFEEDTDDDPDGFGFGEMRRMIVGMYALLAAVSVRGTWLALGNTFPSIIPGFDGWLLLWAVAAGVALWGVAPAFGFHPLAEVRRWRA